MSEFPVVISPDRRLLVLGSVSLADPFGVQTYFESPIRQTRQQAAALRVLVLLFKKHIPFQSFLMGPLRRPLPMTAGRNFEIFSVRLANQDSVTMEKTRTGK